jgi:hypothetical protein
MNLWRMSSLSKHETDESDEVQVCQGAGIALVIFDESAETGGPGK